MAATQISGTLPAGSLLGRYHILTKVAAGGMAEVYAARVQNGMGLSRLVAVKVLHQNLIYEDQFISMFLDEARLAARIRHPNVVSTIDVGETPSRAPFLVMEYIEGDHLGKLLGAAKQAGGRLPVPVTLRIMCDALSGLSAAHELCDEHGKWLQLVHRDVSPHNIMVGCDGVGRLTDFGVAKAEDRLTHTREGQVKGKLSYMAPEQASLGQTDSRSDLFSAGVILWEALVGQRLFRAENSAQTLNKLLHEPIPLPSVHDPALAPLDEVMRKALSRNPEQRFASADAFAAALEKVAPELSGIATRREVGAEVARLAQAKLQRDRVLISAGARGAPGQAEPREVEFHVDIDVEFSTVNLSHSGRGQVASDQRTGTTLPGGPAARRRRKSISEDSLVPPPAAGTIPAPPRSGFRFGKRAAVLILGLSAFGAMLLTTRSRDAVQVVALEQTPVAAGHAETGIETAVQAATTAPATIEPAPVELAEAEVAPVPTPLSDTSSGPQARQDQQATTGGAEQPAGDEQVLRETEPEPTPAATHRKRPARGNPASTPEVFPPLSPDELLENPYLN